MVLAFPPVPAVTPFPADPGCLSCDGQKFPTKIKRVTKVSWLQSNLLLLLSLWYSQHLVISDIETGQID